MYSNTGYTEFDTLITADGQEYRLHDKFRKFILSTAGEGHPPISYITQRGPNQHGSTVIDYRLDERVIQWVIAITAKDRYEYWDNRAWLLDILRLNRNEDESVFEYLKLRKYYSNGKKRQLDVVVEVGPVFQPRNPNDWNEYAIQESLRFIAHNPIYYDPTQICLEWTLAASNQLVFPATFPITFGSQVISDTLNVTYEGTWKTFPVIQITGPLNGAEIWNDTLNRRIKLNYNIPGGRVVTINTQYGNKTIVDNLGSNLIGVIDNPIDLTTFEIAPGAGSTRVNALRVVGSGANSDTAVQVAFYTNYYGI